MDRVEILNDNYNQFEVFINDGFSKLLITEKINLLQEEELLESRLAGKIGTKNLKRKNWRR